MMFWTSPSRPKRASAKAIRAEMRATLEYMLMIMAKFPQRIKTQKSRGPAERLENESSQRGKSEKETKVHRTEKTVKRGGNLLMRETKAE